jgi:uncharacterized circularly permuted ATP-grasp superfamily protein/uncharacterized alpha-E superfamily protein
MSIRGEIAVRNPPRRLLEAYEPVPGIADELLDENGGIRPAWAGFINRLSTISADEITLRTGRADQYLRDAGVFYRHYAPQDAADRDWPLSHIPVLIGETEWKGIAEGLVQRAELLEEVAADLYGDNSLVANGDLPASLVAGNNEWLRPLVGVKPRSGHFLHFVACDIGRGPRGRWWVLGDRTQAPSGAGFALENRVATARAFSDIFAQSNVHRLAGFFRAFRDSLIGLRETEDSRVGILTPGPLNETYFEHAYIARYLGFMLLEGEDLTVRDGQLMVRTIDGLKPMSVLWRRLDASWADPLELNGVSRIGTPGLVGAVRSGGVTLVNALGSGVLETRAFLAFLPRICETLRGEPLALPNIATWWCGGETERHHVRANAGDMTVGNALSTRLPFELDETAAVGGVLRGKTAKTLDEWIESEGPNLVGQEAVKLSTTPVLENGRLVPRPLSLRVFLARTPEGWQVMPGGFARVGHSADPTAIAMQQGGSVADVWIVGDNPVQPDTMLPPRSGPFARSQPGVLPSRAADNLFWLGRYVERSENTVRMLRAYNVRLAETATPDTPLLNLVSEYLEELGVESSESIPSGLLDSLSAAVNSAGHIRDRFSVDGWMALSDLADTAQKMSVTVTPGDDAARAMSVLIRKITGFSGLVHENMYRFTGWRFLSIGRLLERAWETCAVIAKFADKDAPDGSLDLAVDVGDSAMSHRSRYSVATNRATVIDLLALDALNPRSILYQLDEMRDHVSYLPGADIHGQMSPLSRELLRIHTALAIETPETVDTKMLLALRQDIAALSNQITSAYLR